jgi:Flp pilus assembly protein TadB
LRQQQRAQESAGSIIDPAIVGSARTSLDNLGNQVNQALVTRNVGQLIVYAAAAFIAVAVVGALVHVVLSFLPIIIIVALIMYFRRNRGYPRRRM